MVSKRRRDHLKAAREASVASFNKRRSEASSFPIFDQCKIDDNKLSTTDTSNTEDNSQTWFWNESANESDSDSEEEVDNRDDGDEHSETEGKTSSKVLKQELKWNKEGERSLRGGYGSGSRSSRKRERKSARELEKKGSKSYNIKALWQRSRELGILSVAHSQDGLGESLKSLPINPELPTSSLSDVPRGGRSLVSKHEVSKNQRMSALNDLTKLLESVKAQEKQYGGNRLSPHTCCAKRLLSVQEDFKIQKCEIEESINHSFNGHHHIVMYYPKYHCELNHIEHFWCSAKKWARENCNYTLDDLRRRVPRALASVSNHTILAYFHRCKRKMDLYREDIGYGSLQWKARTAHHKPTNKGDDR